MTFAHELSNSKPMIQHLTESLNGYWENNIWYVDNPSFDVFRKTIWDKTHQKIDFTCFPIKLRNEVKYFILDRLKNNGVRLYNTVIVNYSRAFKHLATFLHNFYPTVNSFSDLEISKALIQLKNFLIKEGISVRDDGKLNKHENLLNQLYLFYENYYDTRDESEKDIWDIRKIPGAKVVEHEAHYLLNFKGIPEQFLEMVKRYIKFRITIRSHGQCRLDIRAIAIFLTFINEKYPLWNDLSLLCRKDIEEYLIWYRKITGNHKKAQIHYLITLRIFLETIELHQYEEAPKTPVSLLLFNEDLPPIERLSEHCIKYIPEGVLKQLEDHIDQIRPIENIPIVILLRASGWRISDILNLKYDICLDKTEQGWYLCGDIQKTKVMNHRVPIADEVATIVKSTIEIIKSKSDIINNPKKFLFVRLTGKRKGRPPESGSIRRCLNRLALEYSILDDEGNLFHFKNHAFRHTKAIELINNGMNIIHVQKWMAHASPEMTLMYAKILDTTMRKSWEEATKQGLFRVDDTGKLKKIDISEIENEDIIEWEYIRHNLDAVRMPLGYCMKPKKQECHTQLNPCLTCRNLCTTPDFISQFETEIQETKAVIERGKAQNRSVWVEKNQALLEKYETVLKTLKEGKTHHKAGKKGREYLGEERANA